MPTPTMQDVIRTVEIYSREMSSKIVQMDRKINQMDGKINQMDGKINQMDGKINQMEKKIVQMDGKIDHYHKCTDERLNRLETDVAEIKAILLNGRPR